jgi:lactate dehydrogenase-like 2-hydroxyacid dehydrogenase
LTEETLLSYADQIEIAVGYKFTKEFLDKAVNLKHIQIPWTGAETLDFELIRQYSHFTISNSHSNSLAIAEHAVTLLLSAAKKIVYRDIAMRNNDWSTRYNDVSSVWLTGRTLGVIGYGAIGQKVAQILREGFNMRILAIKRSPPDDCPKEVAFLGTIESLDHVLSKSDYILVALPLTRETRNLIGEKELNLLKPNAILVNIGRGEVIEEEALFNHLEKNKIAGAGLDVWYNYPKDRKNPEVKQNFPFETLPFLVMSPHSAFKVESREIPFAEDIIANLIAVSKGETPTNLLNLELGY